MQSSLISDDRKQFQLNF